MLGACPAPALTNLLAVQVNSAPYLPHDPPADQITAITSTNLQDQLSVLMPLPVSAAHMPCANPPMNELCLTLTLTLTLNLPTPHQSRPENYIYFFCLWAGVYIFEAVDHFIKVRIDFVSFFIPLSLSSSSSNIHYHHHPISIIIIQNPLSIHVGHTFTNTAIVSST